ncbi:ATP-binding cassette domain-containing protein [Arthrobacter sp. SLBN-112]|uniref:ATP-binding cassette domain-containing protein n=1 Tax=Arthrobacter sp. SLBN-112 TaxID=2768452 RepID=UPI0027B3D842|nr:ATP-binding cassette domain-containing protein [Arthrobacter sp. SLBN-112]MDQ0801455.1 ABC-type glutathione transport system ATPase component [Arthrobacter sp. SLBN-112]
MSERVTSAPLLEAKNIVVEFPMKGFRKPPFRVLHGVSLDILPGETVGLVGESGSGKTTIGRAILGLIEPAAGTITFDGQDITKLHRRERRKLSDSIQVVFQDPYTSLNPTMTVGDILSEPLLVKAELKGSARNRIRELLDQVGLPTGAVGKFPREFSGGQRQRVAIARALALSPRLIVCDEPVSALDLSTQARVLDLFIEIQERTGVAYLFVSHDLSVVRHISHRVAVMYKGNIVEYGDGDQVTSDPVHPYTQKLLMSAPVANPVRQRERRLERQMMLAVAGTKGQN